ncbi:hypothetical protein [Jiangella anatolica]|uniref:Uncharacterized protein n=1 Tax=Jiangella anatolica TaxID=2670374 RepID=A0A2W2BID9_9ACTN|nr:hypothetical protein [Jiangella anatolica]PZF80084.1 hypothetical protein C1I92_27775 [Jiangella anatolica]
MEARDEIGSYRESNRATARLALWTLAWAASLAAARFGPELIWDERPAASWAAVGVNVVVGIAWIIAFARFLRALDDLQRKIMQDALAVTLGVGWVGGFAYVVADNAGLVADDVNLALFPTLLGVVYVVAFAVGWIRYR